MNKENFIKECLKLDIEITDEMLEKFNLYLELLKNWNKVMNLTNIIEEKDVYLKHFYDSLCLIKAIDLNKSLELCDVGTGAGFPGIVLKIAFKNLKVTLLEPIGKRCKFLDEVIEKLELKDIKIINERAEIYAKKIREKFDIVTCRAVAKINIISEISIPMVKVNGYFIPMKGNIEEELNKNKEILFNLNSKIEKIIEYKLPIENSFRTLVVIKKISKSPFIYPRNYNIIKKENEEKTI